MFSLLLLICGVFFLFNFWPLSFLFFFAAFLVSYLNNKSERELDAYHRSLESKEELIEKENELNDYLSNQFVSIYLKNSRFGNDDCLHDCYSKLCAGKMVPSDILSSEIGRLNEMLGYIKEEDERWHIYKSVSKHVSHHLYTIESIKPELYFECEKKLKEIYRTLGDDGISKLDSETLIDSVILEKRKK